MTAAERSIVYENGRYWVLDSKSGYSVMISGVTHSRSESTYTRDDDGKSLAIARCDYLARLRP